MHQFLAVNQTFGAHPMCARICEHRLVCARVCVKPTHDTACICRCLLFLVVFPVVSVVARRPDLLGASLQYMEWFARRLMPGQCCSSLLLPFLFRTVLELLLNVYLRIIAIGQPDWAATGHTRHRRGTIRPTAQRKQTSQSKRQGRKQRHSVPTVFLLTLWNPNTTTRCFGLVGRLFESVGTQQYRHVAHALCGSLRCSADAKLLIS